MTARENAPQRIALRAFLYLPARWLEFAYETKAFSYDRGIRLVADAMDVEGAGVDIVTGDLPNQPLPAKDVGGLSLRNVAPELPFEGAVKLGSAGCQALSQPGASESSYPRRAHVRRFHLRRLRVHVQAGQALRAYGPSVVPGVQARLLRAILLERCLPTYPRISTRLPRPKAGRKSASCEK